MPCESVGAGSSAALRIATRIPRCPTLDGATPLVVRTTPAHCGCPIERYVFAGAIGHQEGRPLRPRYSLVPHAARPSPFR